MYSPNYTITNKILKNIGTIEASKEVIDNAPLLPFYEKKFQSEALIRSAYHGTHLEGNELNLSQAERVVMGQHVIARERDIQEIINYRKVMEYIGNLGLRSSAGVKENLTEEIVLKLHSLTVEKILPAELCGAYRKTQVVVKNSITGDVTFRPPPAIAVPFQIKEILEFINLTDSDDVHTVLKSGIAHYEFVRIHPFVDGNGRVSRALATLILFEENYDIRKFFSLEEYFDSDAASYYEALQTVDRNDGNLTQWLEYFTQGLAIELVKVKERVEHVSVDAKLKEKLGGKPLLLSDRQLRIIEYLQSTGYLQNKAFASLFPHVSEDTVLLDIKELIKAGIVKKQGVTKSARYVLTS